MASTQEWKQICVKLNSPEICHTHTHTLISLLFLRQFFCFHFIFSSFVDIVWMYVFIRCVPPPLKMGRNNDVLLMCFPNVSLVIKKIPPTYTTFVYWVCMATRTTTNNEWIFLRSNNYNVCHWQWQKQYYWSPHRNMYITP